MTRLLKVASLSWKTTKTIPIVRREFRFQIHQKPDEEATTSPYLLKPEVKTAWLAEEEFSFVHISQASWIGLSLWSGFCWFLWTTLLFFASLILVSEQKESDRIDIPEHIQLLNDNTLSSMFKRLVHSRDFLEEMCYRKILAARLLLIETKRWFSAYAVGVILLTWNYYFFMGHQLGLPQSQNALLSFKRLIRRRGFAWHALAFGYFYVAYATINVFYDTYIMTPQFRGLSHFSEKRRELFSAYGGKGLALSRVLNNSTVLTPKEEELYRLAKDVAMHNYVPPLTTSIEPVRSPIFSHNWGLKYRSAQHHDDIPTRCWFNNEELFQQYNKSHEKMSETVKRKMERMARRKQILEERKLLEKAKPNTTNERNKKVPQSTPSTPPPVKFQIGKSFGASKKDERFLRASQLQINKAMLARLKTIDLLILVNGITDKVSNAENFVEGFVRTLDYLSLFSKFNEQRHFITSINRKPEWNQEENCLCNYYPYYGGYFK